MRTPDIQLTPQEQQLLSQICFGSTEHEKLRASLAPMAEVSDLLLKRNAIPEVRRQYFIDPERNPGSRGKSRLQVFVRNGTPECEITGHPHFMKYLEYFLYGPNLPKAVIERFQEVAKCSGYLSGGDFRDLIPEARATVRSLRLKPPDASEEFYKLVLECGGMASSAESMRKAIRSVKL